MINLALDRAAYVAGDHVAGSVHISGDRTVRGVRVELEAEDRSGSRRDSSESITSCHLDVPPNGGPALVPFRLLVPANVIRNYQLKKTSRTLRVSARADVRGFDPERGVPIQVAAPTIEGSEGIAAERASHVALAFGRHPKWSRVAGLCLVASALLMAALVAYWLVDQSSTWHAGDRSDVLFATGYGILGGIAGVMLLVFGQERPVDNVDVDLPKTTFRPGDSVAVRVSNALSHPIDVGLVMLERYSSGGNNGTSRRLVKRRARQQWVEAPPGWSEHSFPLDRDSPPSYAGTSIGVDYDIRAVSGGPAPRRLPLRCTRKRLIVL